MLATGADLDEGLRADIRDVIDAIRQVAASGDDAELADLEEELIDLLMDAEM
ncbi:MAG: hypothetical protein R3A10_10050 [Caldilineaceae bacterium]